MKISCLVVDDMKMSREAMHDLISSVEFLIEAGSCENATEALTKVNELEPDVIFLDIEMPGMSGLEFIKTLNDPPLIVLTTSHKEFALEGYEQNVFDYLVKPVTHERFFRSANKIFDHFKSHRPAIQQYQIFVKANNKYVRVKFSEILYVEAMRDFVVVYTEKAKLVTLMNLKEFTSQLPEDLFMRVHRSYVVPVNKVEFIDGNTLIIQNNQIPIGESYKNKVMRQLLGRED